MTYPIEPAAVVQAVDRYVRDELAQAKNYDNRSPLDESGVYSLHMLAAEVYAMAWDEATRAAEVRRSAVHEREHDRKAAEQ